MSPFFFFPLGCFCFFIPCVDLISHQDTGVEIFPFESFRSVRNESGRLPVAPSPTPVILSPHEHGAGSSFYTSCGVFMNVLSSFLIGPPDPGVHALFSLCHVNGQGIPFLPPLPVENLLCFFWSHLSFGLRSMCVVLKAGYHIPSCSSSSIMCVTVRHSYFPWSLSVRSNGRHVGKDTGGMTGYIDYHVFLVMCHALSVIGLVKSLRNVEIQSGFLMFAL